ncbi:hypothetical protein EC973_000254 [Apophysomyces ossiformis]|uniref:RCC1-like domain-containing protein n=1 Tax=Apophysomyces ossiformis TaxID=679940 RepID=A0A8H7BYB9_9FUNG|nr:hypothetical protein EC973_000254 [Apophysomyces ossiformis]
MLLYGFGSNGSGQLGVGHEEDMSKPTLCIGIPANEHIVKVVGGGNHSAVLTKSGRVFLAGSGQWGEAKQKTMERSHGEQWTTFHEPVLLQNDTWRDVACGWAFTLLVSQSGRVYGFGSARFGELGPEVLADTGLVEVQGLQGIVAVACGWRHCVALDRKGHVFGWGWARHGQLGQRIGKQVKVAVQQLEEAGICSEIACGHLHTVLRRTDGTVLVFGSNKHGQLDDPKVPATHLSAGWHHNAILTSDNKLIGWGRNDHYQLHELENVSAFICGSEHTLAQQDNTVLAWGWNEHGNCGMGQDSTEPSPITLPQGRIVLLGAGCATSWIGIEPFEGSNSSNPEFGSESR